VFQQHLDRRQVALAGRQVQRSQSIAVPAIDIPAAGGGADKGRHQHAEGRCSGTASGRGAGLLATGCRGTRSWTGRTGH
jgi:hypothetical protein